MLISTLEESTMFNKQMIGKRHPYKTISLCFSCDNNKRKVAALLVRATVLFSHPYAFHLYLRLSKHCSLPSSIHVSPIIACWIRVQTICLRTYKTPLPENESPTMRLRLLSFLLLSHQKTFHQTTSSKRLSCKNVFIN